MADNVTQGSVPVATDEVSYSGDAGKHVQLIRIVQTTGAEGSKTVVDIPADASNGLDVDVTRLPALVAGSAKIGDVGLVPYRTRIQVSPTVSTSAYASGDVMGGQMTFSNAARASGGYGLVLGATVFCKTPSLAWVGLELVLFDRSVTVASDNAANAYSDADMLFCLGAIRLDDWIHYANGSIVHRDLQMPFKLNGSDLFAQLVTRSAVTLGATTDIAVTLDILQQS